MRVRFGARAVSLFGAMTAVLGAVSGPAQSEVPFTFTVPQSQVIVKISEPALRSDPVEGARPGYFKLSRARPLLILSGWLEPAQQYKGLEAFWAAELRSPALTGATAPTHVETLREGGWEVVAYDVSVAGLVQVHLRAERVEANAWIDLHLSTRAADTSKTAKSRAELLKVLRQVQIVRK
ncbi:hypothetical protein SSBR45G_03750 [Bradyrhizobium sp. SSBR45G]|uniref:hypothetical protein n=1 Tax=unclassified Bradyrhizobium TaxID=2631580 RepID=UPI002342AA73|nr:MULTISPECIES: hypothetical protein [unclassified Bradyrhizobium]GLH75467.1 hypothetical protein SSBR45G_03750 [Bradyrhizobium sp. SSBR45G]GLH82746.1 hypothetical protein SSBR45R_02060 [Bradyrhizobium sp. SSBR45R]